MSVLLSYWQGVEFKKVNMPIFNDLSAAGQRGLRVKIHGRAENE
jgi:hypothetical protein